MAGNDVHTRRTILKFIVFLIFGTIACRIGYIQLIDTRYKSMAAGPQRRVFGAEHGVLRLDGYLSRDGQAGIRHYTPM